MISNILEQHKKHFGEPHIIVKSPGRANIIGEHTDYNNGLVFPFAISQHVEIFITPNSDHKLNIRAHDIDAQDSISLDVLSFMNTSWQRYFINSLVALNLDQKIGLDVTFGGNLPQGGGVSSSSAITCGFLAGINALYELDLDLDALIRLASQAENGIGLHGGTMDQTAILKGQNNKALMIDFDNSSVSLYDLPSADQYKFYLFNSGQKHNLVETEYNKRRATCDLAVKQVRSIDPTVTSLRQMTMHHVEHILDGEISKKRCQHVIEENKRVKQAGTALVSGDLSKLGHLLSQTHDSLSQLYEVSTPEIDFLVTESKKISNVLGSRIMGGGFGGCTINLVKGSLKEQDFQQLAEKYTLKTGLPLSYFEVEASAGVQVTRHFPQT